MGGEKSLLWSICVVLTLFIVVVLIDYFVILHTKIEFDIVAQQYFWICEQNVGLSNDEQLELKNKLSKKGYENIEVVAPNRGGVSRGDYIVFSIKSTKELSKRNALFMSNKEQIQLEYNREAISRRVVN